MTLDEHRPPNHRAAALLTPEAIRPRPPASVARSGCWPTGSSPTPIIPTRPRARSPDCDWAGQHGTVPQAAATAALSANVRSYRFVQHLLAKGRIEAVEDPAGGLGPHANLRGPAYYH